MLNVVVPGEPILAEGNTQGVDINVGDIEFSSKSIKAVSPVPLNHCLDAIQRTCGPGLDY